ncbi:hypothetical protein ACIOWI_24725 [Streptomyces sp. NPDC087659]|uniref:hypothetical protein n=1 Tax=Streptomyces sp. NPDC087659 TaxID=3365801 RepID=UPI0038152EE4
MPSKVMSKAFSAAFQRMVRRDRRQNPDLHVDGVELRLSLREFPRSCLRNMPVTAEVVGDLGETRSLDLGETNGVRNRFTVADAPWGRRIRGML